MKKNIVEAIKKLITERASDLDAIKITWFGGEPLAAKDIVYDVCSHVMNLKTIYPDLKYMSDMTTNGYKLTDNTLLKLVDHGVSHFQISLDGTEEVHDKSRVRMDGAGTFSYIWNNLLSAKKTNLDFSIILRVHVTPENLDNIYKLIDLIKLNFGKDKRFTVFLKAIENLGGPNAASFSTLRGQNKKDVLQSLHEYLGADIGATNLNSEGPYVCYAAMTNSFAIRADGKIGKCTVALNDDRNIVGEIMDDGSIAVKNDKFALWTRGIKSQNLTELSCPMYQLPQLGSKLVSRLNSIPIVIQG